MRRPWAFGYVLVYSVIDCYVLNAVVWPTTGVLQWRGISDGILALGLFKRLSPVKRHLGPVDFGIACSIRLCNVFKGFGCPAVYVLCS